MTRKDGQPIRANARYLVLDYSGADPHAIKAIEAYAASTVSNTPESIAGVSVIIQPDFTMGDLRRVHRARKATGGAG